MRSLEFFPKLISGLQQGLLGLSQALSNLHALKEIVLMRGGDSSDLGFVEMALHALSNTQILYDYVALEDPKSVVVLRR